MLKPGTIVEMLNAAGVAPERCTVIKPRRVNLPMPGPDWSLVKFEDGGKLCVHDTGLRVIGERIDFVDKMETA